MDLRQLQYFAEVCRVGTFLGAAATLEVAQPTLWRQVKSLEADLGVALFERSGRGVRITAAGQQMLPLAEQLLRRAEALVLLGSEMAIGRAGVVSVACPHPHVPRFLAQLVGNFHRRQPGVHVALHESPDLPSALQVLEGDVDFVTALPQRDEGLAGHRLGEVRLIVVLADDHPWRRRTEVTTEELRGQPVLVGTPGSLTQRLLEPALRHAGFELTTALESANATTLIAMARAGLGIAVLADDNVPHGASPEWPVLVDTRFPMATPVWMYWAAHRELPPPAQTFLKHVQSGSAGDD